MRPYPAAGESAAPMLLEGKTKVCCTLWAAAAGGSGSLSLQKDLLSCAGLSISYVITQPTYNAKGTHCSRVALHAYSGHRSDIEMKFVNKRFPLFQIISNTNNYLNLHHHTTTPQPPKSHLKRHWLSNSKLTACKWLFKLQCTLLQTMPFIKR